MVKKKRRTRKISKKKIRISKRGIKSPAQIKRDLDLFSKGVDRLKELERELRRLDTRGFAKEEQEIRSVLKNVSDIPLIEKKLKNLKQKINNKYKPKRKRVSSSKIVKKEVKEISDRIPRIDSGLKKLNKRVEEMFKKRGRIDSDIDLLIDKDFAEFIDDIKSKVSENIRQKSRSEVSFLKKHLKNREKKLNEKYYSFVRGLKQKKRKLEREVRARYSERLKGAVKSKASKGFKSIVNKKVREKLKSGREALAKKYKEIYKQQAQKDLAEYEKKLRWDFAKKLKELSEREQECVARELAKIRANEKRFEAKKQGEINRLNSKIKRLEKRK